MWRAGGVISGGTDEVFHYHCAEGFFFIFFRGSLTVCRNQDPFQLPCQETYASAAASKRVNLKIIYIEDGSASLKLMQFYCKTHLSTQHILSGLEGTYMKL